MCYLVAVLDYFVFLFHGIVSSSLKLVSCLRMPKVLTDRKHVLTYDTNHIHNTMISVQDIRLVIVILMFTILY
mgnify:FL=1